MGVYIVLCQCALVCYAMLMFCGFELHVFKIVNVFSCCRSASVTRAAELCRLVRDQAQVCQVKDSARLRLADMTVVDEVALWWSALVDVAVCWTTGDNDTALKLYPILDTLPQTLKMPE